MKEKQKIAIVTWFFPKISETFILNQIVFLIDNGYEIKIFAARDATKNIPKEDLYVEEKIHPALIQYNLLKKTTYVPVGNLSKILTMEAQAGKINIIYFQFSDLASLVLKDGAIHIPVITVIHDIPKITIKNQKLLKNKFYNAFQNATFVLAISDFAKNKIIKLGCSPLKIIIHPMGVNNNIFSFKARKFPLHKLCFTMVGRFVPKKGFDIGIRAIEKFKKQNQNLKISVNLIGDGYLRSKLEILVNKLGLQKEVTFLGKIDQLAVVNILKDTDIFLCPSKTDSQGEQEGLPVSLIEASFMGIPIVTTSNAAIPELASINKSIVLVPEGSVVGLVDGINKVFKYHSLYLRLINQYYKNLVEHYDINVLGINLINIFDYAIKINILRDTQEGFSSNRKIK
ncbi:MAG: glycosyltransferase [Patescibacteria group bacterium]